MLQDDFWGLREDGVFNTLRETQCIIHKIASKYTNMKVIKTEKITSNSDRVYYTYIQTRQ